jgi:type VI secretion system protein ImpL
MSADATVPSSEGVSIIVWGLALFAIAVATFALAVVWIMGDVVFARDVETQKTFSLWILGVLIGILILHIVVFRTGTYLAMGALFRREDRSSAIGENTVKAPKRDAHLSKLRAELRASYGWRWRYRQPWLLITGDDELTEAVAPGLCQFGFVLTEHAVLLHAAPANIDAAIWRKQLRCWRRRRPVDAVVQVMRVDHASRADPELPRVLATQALDLGWAAPIWLLHVVEAGGKQPDSCIPVGLVLPERAQAPEASIAALEEALTTAMRRSAHSGVMWISRPPDLSPLFSVRYMAELSLYMDERRPRIVAGFVALAQSKWRRAALAGMMFAPVFARLATVASNQDDAPPPSQPPSVQPTWRFIGDIARIQRGRRLGFYWPNACAALFAASLIVWCLALGVSYFGNQRLISNAQANAHAALAAVPGTPAALRAQLALQQTIEMLEAWQQHGVPWSLRAGLSHNDALLAALWPAYRTVSERNLLDPVMQSLRTSLTRLAQLPADSVQDSDTTQRGYNVLKAYLILAQPERSDAAFLQPQILAAWPTPGGMTQTEWLDSGQRLAAFYAEHLEAHPEWRTKLDPPNSITLIAAARATLINQIGLSNADDTLYQGVLREVQGKYSDATLATLLNGVDARGLFATAHSVPGVYTRAAWDGAVADAIERVSREHTTAGDWVLTRAPTSTPTSTSSPGPASSHSVTGASDTVSTQSTVTSHGAAPHATPAHDAPEQIKARLTARYFAVYTAAWQSFLNSIQWQPAANLSGAISQLTRLADAQQSPLLALMQAVRYQAQAGRPSQGLSDTLVRQAQSLLHGTITGNRDTASAALAVRLDAPLDQSFGPLLALMGDADSAATHSAASVDISLARYLTLVTTVRLKLQQISTSPDPQAMTRALAAAVFQGKLSDLMQARDDAKLIAASLGRQWAGFGDALLAQPLDAAWQTVLSPAAASLNEFWRAGIATPFNSAFNGRYPFAGTQVDASFAELGRYIRPDTGLIAKFIATQLSGVLQQQGDRWVRNPLAPQALQFDPAFLQALTELATLGAQGYTQGDAAYRFELMPMPTVDVTRTALTIDGQPLVYFNQQESWTTLAWPGDGLHGEVNLSWKTIHAGTRQAFDSTGDWAFLRLLEQAQVTQLDSTRYALNWPQPDAETLHYVLRTQVGAGPIELLKLRGFKLPERIFIVDALAAASNMVSRAGALLPLLPPLPSLPEEMEYE